VRPGLRSGLGFADTIPFILLAVVFVLLVYIAYELQQCYAHHVGFGTCIGGAQAKAIGNEFVDIGRSTAHVAVAGAHLAYCRPTYGPKTPDQIIAAMLLSCGGPPKRPDDNRCEEDSGGLDSSSIPGPLLTPDPSNDLKSDQSRGIIGGTSNSNPGPRPTKVPIPNLSGKEGAKDVPSWARGERPYVDEDGKAFAKRLMDERFGEGNWSTKSTEYSQIKKWGTAISKTLRMERRAKEAARQMATPDSRSFPMARMTFWEYLFVDCNLGPDTWRPRFANRERLPDWDTGTPVHEYCNRLGAEGWELVSSQVEAYESDSSGRIKRSGRLRVTESHRRVWRLVFKRPGIEPTNPNSEPA
jgi:hypothetical protein